MNWLSVYPSDRALRQPWRNGEGFSTEVARVDDGPNMRWRLSVAEIETDAHFSTFPGCSRLSILLTGEGFTLHSDLLTLTLTQRGAALRYAGDTELHATLHDGRCSVINLIWASHALQVDAWYRPIVGSMVLFRESGVQWLVYVATGQIVLRQGEQRRSLTSGSAALVDFTAEQSPSRVVLDGGGELALFKLRLGAEG